MCFLISRPQEPPEYAIITDKGNNGYTEEDYENELEQALQDNYELIVIEPPVLGEETARWIKVGNCLHKTSVISGAVCLIGHSVDDRRPFIYISLGVISVVCAGIYAISWRSDPCCKYQVEDDLPRMEQLLSSLNSVSPVVLVRKDDGRRRKLHNIVSLISGLLCAWKVYKWLIS